MAKFESVPVQIDAVLYNGANFDEIQAFMGGKADNTLIEQGEPTFFITTLEGVMKASKGDYIIRGLEGEFYPCKPSIFERKYKLVAG